MMMPSFRVFRRFNCSKVLNPGAGRQGVHNAGAEDCLDPLRANCPAAILILEIPGPWPPPLVGRGVGVDGYVNTSLPGTHLRL